MTTKITNKLEKIIDDEIRTSKQQKRQEKKTDASATVPAATPSVAGSKAPSDTASAHGADERTAGGSTAGDTDMIKEEVLCTICETNPATDLRLNQILAPRLIPEVRNLCGPECGVKHISREWNIPITAVEKLMPWWNHEYIKGRKDANGQWKGFYHPITEEEIDTA